MEQQSIDSLFGKYLNNQSSPAEVDQLLEWLEDPLNAEAQKELIGRQLSMQTDGFGYTDTFLQEQLKDTLRAILHEINAKPIQRAEWYRLKWFRAAAAAAIMFMLGAGSFYFLSRNAKKDSGSQFVPSSTRDVAPPVTANAILTLANGARIVLDRARSGSLAVQGNTEVTKQAEGQLVYKGTAAAGAGLMYNTLTVPRGSKVVYVNLADGSKVWMNSASSLRYPTAFAGRERLVELTGEAYFEVAGNAAMPFIVKKGNAAVYVLGTHFNVNAYDDEGSIKITLLEGSVRTSINAASEVLIPGQQAQINAGRISLNKVADMEEVMAWKNGRFELNGNTIGPIMRQVARWYDVDIEYKGALPTDNFMGSTSRQENVSELLKILEQTGAVRFHIENKKITVMKQ